MSNAAADGPVSGKMPARRLRWERMQTACAFLAALGALIAEHWLARLSFRHVEQFPWLGHHSSALFSIALASTCGLAWWLSWMHHRRPRPRSWRILPQLLVLFLLLLTGNWCALAGERWMEHGPLHLESSPVWFALIALGGLAAFGAIAARLRSRLLHPRNLDPHPMKDLPVARHPRVLILFVSTPTLVPEIASDAAAQGFHARLLGRDGKTVQDLKGKDLAADLAAIDTYQATAEEYWNWQQPLRALRHHQRLTQVWLVGSPDGPGFVPAHDHLVPGHRCNVRGGQGSVAYLERFARPLVQAYTRAAVRVAAQPVSFEDFDAVVSVVRDLLSGPVHSVPPTQIMLDVTGGVKITSIAGAALTMNRELRFQYVQTNKPYETLTFDLSLRGPLTPHGNE